MNLLNSQNGGWRTVTAQLLAILSILSFATMSARATAVRATAISLGLNGQTVGGYYDLTGPGGGRRYVGSYFQDSTPNGDLTVFISDTSPGNYVSGALDFHVGTPNVYVRNNRTGVTTCPSCRVAFGSLYGWGGYSARISTDGRYVVYNGPDISTLDAPVNQIWRADLQTGDTVLVTIAAAGGEGNFDSYSPVVGGDGRYVSYLSTATNLVLNYTSAPSLQIYQRDIQSGTTQLVTHAYNSVVNPGNRDVEAQQPISMTDDGRYVVWTSPATNHVFGTDQNNADDVFMWDRDNAPQFNVFLISHVFFSPVIAATGTSTGGIVAREYNLSPVIAFASTGVDINPGDTDPHMDIFIDTTGGAETDKVVSIARDGTAANGTSDPNVALSANGRYVAFSSLASNLVTGIDEPGGNTHDVFVRDIQTNQTRYASLDQNGHPCSTVPGATLPSPVFPFFFGSNNFVNRSVSDDGRFVLFTTAESLSGRDNANTPDLYVGDTVAQSSILVTLNTSLFGGENANLYNSATPALTADGHMAFFSSDATNLMAGDATGTVNAKVYQSHVSHLAQRSLGDFNGDQKTEFSVWRPSEGAWYSLFDVTGGGYGITYLGESGDRIVPGDYDGDGQTDVAVFLPQIGRWDILQSSDNTIVSKFFGTATDIPTPGDYDGDGRTDLAYFRPATGTWFILQSNTNTLRTVHFGVNGDVPVVGDFDGDNRSDIAVFRAGAWYILRSSDGAFSGVSWGLAGDVPMAADFDGDGHTDIAVFRAGDWYILNSRDGSFRALHWGSSGDRVVPSDYDGDGLADVAVFRPSNSAWYVLQSSDQQLNAVSWGTTGDIAVPAAFVP